MNTQKVVSTSPANSGSAPPGIPCSTCKGEGMVPWKHVPTGQVNTIPCPACRGKGVAGLVTK